MQRCAHSLSSRPATRTAFSLIELLVVVAIIALLVSMLLPSLGRAKQQAGVAVSLSNLRQIGIGLHMYNQTYRGGYPVHGTSTGRKIRWADYLWPYLRSPEVYMSPMLTADERDNQMRKPFAHTCRSQNRCRDPGQTASTTAGTATTTSTSAMAERPAGSGPSMPARPTSACRPAPLPSLIRMARRTAAAIGRRRASTASIRPACRLISVHAAAARVRPNPAPASIDYRGGDDGDASRRATPAERNMGKVNIIFCDGHADGMTLKEMDDSNGDGEPDNGYWNGRGDPANC